MPIAAALIGHNFEISGSGCRFPDVAYGSTSRKYLVVWADYNVGRIFGRLVTDNGAVDGGVFEISEAPYGGLFPAIAYNAVNNEFLVTWDSFGMNNLGVNHDGTYGQRVRASDGTLLGPNIGIGSSPGDIRSAVAWSGANNVYLVVFWIPGGMAEVYGQRVSGNGTLLGGNFNISNDTVFSGYPAVAWSADGNQFLVSWDNEDGSINWRRVDAATGSLLPGGGGTAPAGKDRSCVAYDSINRRWLVQFNYNNPGFSYDQFGQFVNTNGALIGGAIPLAHTPGFEGDTQFGGDIAFVPLARRFFSSFGTDTGMGGQESFADGTPVVTQVVLGTGFYTSLNNAADPQRNRFLTAWEGKVGNTFLIFGQLYAATINPVSNFVVTAQSSQNTLGWRNPNDSHFTGTMIRYRTDGYPTGPEDGFLAIDKTNAPGANDTFTHMNLANWTTYYYAAFAHDVGSNYAAVTQAAGTPRPAVVNISSSDFSAGADGWIFATWQAGNLAPGSISWDGTAGNIVCAGAGASNNRDSCTREGSMMTKAISTAGRPSIQIEYDVMAALFTPPTGSPGGSCTPLEGSIEDKLVVYYSITGTNGPWTIAQVLSEGVELPTDWTRKLINLAGVAGVSNNANFALRFQWQFNSGSDTGRIDNIHVLSGAVTALTPSISLSAKSLERTIQAGQNLPSDVFRVGNSGEGILNFTVTENAAWLAVSPTVSSSSGPERTITISYTTANLALGDYSASIQIASTNAGNSPQTLTVNLHVIPQVCFWEPFNYYDGSLATMGSINWSGSATSEIQADGGTLKILGGGGLFSVAHSLNCAGSNGVIAVQMKAKKGTGSGDFFWNIVFDDASGNNLARWYGGSSIARGRVSGGTPTADMNLTGENTWDDLYITIDTRTNTSEFFFNGVSFGSISHDSTPGDSIGSVRIERLDRSSAVNDAIHFDSITIGAVDLTPPRLGFSRSENALLLSWTATGAGAKLESASNLTKPISWTAVTNGIFFMNGSNGYATSTSNSNRFFRLHGS